MCIQVHCVECAKIRVLDPVLYWKIQPRENPYSGIFYAVVSDSRTVRIIYFCFKICSVQLLFDTAQFLFQTLFCALVLPFYWQTEKKLWFFHVITFELINIQIFENFLFAKRGCFFWRLNVLFLVTNTNCKF